MIACNSCATAINNADTSHIAEDDLSTVIGNIEEAGLLAMTHFSEVGLFVCDFCEYGYYGDSYKYEAA